ncbi:MAG TPA: hypothetical protein VN437_04140, partial [Rectinemataceae bacterium]|nr:hypothetical protein [Rectinemataceae bacterium]
MAKHFSGNDDALSTAQKDLAAKFSGIVARAKAEGRDSLTEVEGLAMLDAMGISAPRHHFVTSSADYEALASGSSK